MVDNLRLAAFAAAVLMVIGGLGPWVTTGDGLISVNGSDRDGAIVIGSAVVYAIALLTGRRRLIWVAALAALVASVTSVVDLADIASEPLVDPGWGLWLDAAASLVAFVLAAGLRRRARGRRS